MSIFDLAYQGINNGMDATNLAASMYGSTGTIADGMMAYQNPFEQQVIQNAQTDLMRQAEMLLQNNRAGASSAGAFGGSRHGVVDALTNEATIRSMADMTSNLRLQGFNTMGNFANQDIQNRLNSASGLVQAGTAEAGIGATGFDMGQTIQNNQMQQGSMLQMLQQGILDQASGMYNNFVSQPLNILDMRSAAATGSPLNAAVTQTQTSTPGLFDYLSLGFGAGAANKKAGKK